MRCDEIMKRDIACVLPSDDVCDAALKMRDYNVGFLPVCASDGRVLGAITDRDLALRVLAEGRPGDTIVDEVYTSEIIACRPTDDVRLAERLMAEFQKSRIMCTDEAGRLVGVISLSDIAQHDDERHSAQTMRRITDREARSTPIAMP